MHTMWKGAIQFGLVNVPVKMYAATENKDIKFRYLHKECNTPIQYVRQCPVCKKEVGWEEIVKGFEYQPDQFVIVEDDEIAALAGKKSKTIDIIDFVDLSEIDPIFFDKTYYLAPESTSEKAYRLLQLAMEKTNKIAIAKVVIRSTETLAAIRIYEGFVVMETIFYPDEVRSVDQLPQITDTVEVSEKELDMAVQLIDNLATPFDPKKYTDEYRKALTELLEAKIEGEQVTVAAPKQTGQIIDLMKALQASLAQTKQPELTTDDSKNGDLQSDEPKVEGRTKPRTRTKKKAAGA